MCLLKTARSPSGVAIVDKANEIVKKAVVSFMSNAKKKILKERSKSISNKKKVNEKEHPARERRSAAPKREGES